jgi:hypothetical protein
MTADSSQTPPRRPAWLRFRIGYVIILAADVLFGVKFVQQAWQDHQRGQQLAIAESQYDAQLRQTNARQKQNEYYSTIAFVLQQARAWGYVKRGDQPVLILYRHPSHVRHRTEVHVRPARPKPAWLQWWQAFFGG